MKRLLFISVLLALVVPLTLHDQGQLTGVGSVGGVGPIGPAVSGSTFPSTTSIAAYWKMDENVGNSRLDSSGNSNTLTEQTTCARATGKINYAADPTGAADRYLTIIDNASIGMAGGEGEDLTITCWCQVDAIATRALVYKGTGTGAASEYRLFLNDGTGSADYFSFTVGNGSTYQTIAASEFGTISADGTTWYFVAGRYDSAANLLYLFVGNGVTSDHMTPLSYTGGSQNTAANLDICNLFNGRIDEVSIWRRFLSEAEVEQLYGNGSPPSYP